MCLIFGVIPFVLLILEPIRISGPIGPLLGLLTTTVFPVIAFLYGKRILSNKDASKKLKLLVYLILAFASINLMYFLIVVILGIRALILFYA